MNYDNILDDIDEMESNIKDYCSIIANETKGNNQSIDAEYNSKIKQLWKKITNGMHTFYSDYQIKFEDLSILMDSTFSSNRPLTSASEIDKQLISYMRFYDITYYTDTKITINSIEIKPDFTIYLPFINKYLLIKYVSENTEEIEDLTNYDIDYLQNTIFIHKNDKKHLIRYEFEMQLIKILRHCLENNYMNITRQV